MPKALFRGFNFPLYCKLNTVLHERYLKELNNEITIIFLKRIFLFSVGVITNLVRDMFTTKNGQFFE